MRLLDIAKQTSLIISNEEMNDIMKIVNSLEELGILIKALAKQFKMKQNNKKVDLLGILGARLLGNLLKGKSKITASQGSIRTDTGFGSIL